MPDYAEEAYVYMAAFHLFPEFDQPQDGTFWRIGESIIRAAVNLPSQQTTPAEYF